VLVKLPEPLFIYLFFDGFCFLCQLNCPDLCFFDGFFFFFFLFNFLNLFFFFGFFFFFFNYFSG